MEQMPATRTPSSPVKASSAAPTAPPAGSVTKRLSSELMSLMMSSPPGIVSCPVDPAADDS
ncbi:hypothetical protein M407DRAFT_19968 [Tulasnella calospora MUT 4182]|uniref:Uncharacterized protein n=1 Tax=Tulasnella calospora MUT 4182 TaxID=1051891 RepID=A0A0C3QH33_9AGAM|nr:hypothetical protein M407DRAFT_19968 [Tulasnella calospora MUT 4182]